jgi:hypothetical protein
MATITLDRVVEAYTNSREDIRALEDKISEIKAVQAKREEWMLSQLEKDGLQNAKTQHGTVYKTLKESVTVGDADAFFEWVRENDKFEFLNKAANKTAVLELMGEKRSETPPPGVNYSATRAVGVRKS